MHIANKMAIETVATVVKGAGQHSGPQGTIVEAEEKVRSLIWLLELKYYKRLTSTHFLFTCCSEAAVKREMSQHLSFTMVPCGPECWPAPFTTVVTVSNANLLAMCIVVPTLPIKLRLRLSPRL